ncbi:hypothetical protein Tcan_04533 [Toxocara canis]|uniref:DUF7808 domain-containing protein n=1 Tax=Toxocara canis TaxID=6265 RepID=A0A0B2VI51_TOXCA|nr:hypothetical protein Tcan_04533 [Toxocara canis]
MTAYLISKHPATNNKCIQFFNYKMEERGGEWFLWRTGRCLTTEIQFDIECLFDYPESDANDLRVYLKKKKVEH